MSHPIDVGSVLGGRYKVTATVLTSHDHDLVLDGVDQVLNRPVSILVAGPDNTEQVAQSAREVATGERPGHMQILDLGVSESTTYLITDGSSQFSPWLADAAVQCAGQSTPLALKDRSSQAAADLQKVAQTTGELARRSCGVIARHSAGAMWVVIWRAHSTPLPPSHLKPVGCNDQTS